MKKFIIAFTLLLSSCNFSSRFNDQDDINKGKELAGKYYAHQKNRSYGEVSAMCGAELNGDDAVQLLQQIENNWGKCLEVNFVSGQSSIKEKNGEVKGEIDLNYKVKYENSTNTESIVLKYVNNELKIAGIHSTPEK
ncbi:MAG: hypothetical protein HY064_09860 [Bacteroidetes bacterium]|nr:hypothetical protein [Bacteroidota bacterium]